MKKSEALRLAKELVSVHQGHADEGPSTFSEAAIELRRLSAIEEAAKNLVKVKGRFNTEQAFNKLKELLT